MNTCKKRRLIILKIREEQLYLIGNIALIIPMVGLDMIHLIKIALSILILSFIIYPTSTLGQADEINNQFRVMTYNIRYAGDEKIDGVNAWSIRKSLVANMIDFNHADIVGVQEALYKQLNDLSTLLEGYSWFGVGRDDGINKGEFSAILFKVDRFKVIEQS